MSKSKWKLICEHLVEVAGKANPPTKIKLFSHQEPIEGLKASFVGYDEMGDIREKA